MTRRCTKCGKPETDHPYRHPFQSTSDPATDSKASPLEDAIEVERLKAENAKLERERDRHKRARERMDRARRVPMHESLRGELLRALATLARCSDEDDDYGGLVQKAKREWQATVDAMTAANEANAKLREAAMVVVCSARTTMGSLGPEDRVNHHEVPVADIEALRKATGATMDEAIEAVLRHLDWESSERTRRIVGAQIRALEGDADPMAIRDFLARVLKRMRDRQLHETDRESKVDRAYRMGYAECRKIVDASVEAFLAEPADASPATAPGDLVARAKEWCAAMPAFKNPPPKSAAAIIRDLAKAEPAAVQEAESRDPDAKLRELRAFAVEQRGCFSPGAGSSDPYTQWSAMIGAIDRLLAEPSTKPSNDDRYLFAATLLMVAVTGPVGHDNMCPYRKSRCADKRDRCPWWRARRLLRLPDSDDRDRVMRAHYLGVLRETNADFLDALPKGGA